MPFSTLKFKVFVALFAIMFFFGKAEASHLLGTEFYYEHISGDTFLLKLKIYRDCHGIHVSETPFTITPNGKSAYSVSGKLSGGTDITPICQSACSECKDPTCKTNLGVEEYFLEALVVLPDCEYTIGWEQCCRSVDITTGASSQNYYTEIKLNKCIIGNSSSPAFLTKPYILGCIDQCTSVLQGAAGNPGDSLVHKFADPKADPYSNVPYANGYSKDEPFLYQAYPNKDSAYNYPSCNGLHLNPQTGELNFKAVQEDVTVMVIEVEQWHKDNSGIYRKIATIRKDALLNLLPCLSNSMPNNQPLISGADSSGDYEIHLCANDTSSFTIHTSDPDKSDSVYVKWSNSIPGATFTVKNTQHQKATFTWNPDDSLVRTETYRFIVRAEDNLCPLPSYVEKQFKIYVHPELPDFQLIKQKGKCNEYSFRTNNGAELSKLNYKWFVNDSLAGNDTILTHTFTKTGRNIIRLSLDENCAKHFYDSVYIEKVGEIFNNRADTICFGDTLNVTAGGGQIFQWKNAINISDSTASNVQLFPTVSTTYFVEVTDTLTNCTRTDSFYVHVNSIAYAIANSSAICLGDTMQLSASANPNQTYLWTPNTNISDIHSASPKFYPATSTTYYVEIIDTITGCKKLDSLHITVSSLTYSVSGSKTICFGDTATLTVAGGNKYLWTPNANISSSTSSSPKVYPNLTTTYFVEISDTLTGCVKYDSVRISVVTTCVWPGDANLDKTADYLDILDIALGYSANGIPRVNASTDWIPQASKDWSNTLSSGINYKHLDTNGDSIIDATDTLAVAKNYGKSHLKNDEPQLTGNPNDPPLYFQFDKNYYLAGDTVKAALYLGSADKPVKDVYGLGMKHFFANSYMENETYSYNWDCEMLCGANDNFQLYRQFNDKSTGEGAIIRTDKLTTSNPYGKVANVEFVLKDSSFNYPKEGTNISLQILKSRLIDMNGNEIPVYTKADEVKVYRTQADVVGLKENTNWFFKDVKIYPNPASNKLTVETGKHIFTSINVVNSLGQEVKVIQLTKTNKTSVDVADLPAGIYFIHIYYDEKILSEKFIISR